MIGKVPEPTIRRLPFYLAHIKLLRNSGQQFISSTQLAKDIGVDSSQVAKDLSFIDITGKTRVGYEIKPLIEVLESFLGFSVKHKAYLFGAGSLGSALLQDTGLRQFGLFLSAAFDVNPDIVGTLINSVPIRHVDEYFDVRKKTGVEIGILSVPAEKAQEVADFMIEGGIRGIWNFTPVKIKVPSNAVVQNTSLYAHLALIFNKLIHGDKF